MASDAQPRALHAGERALRQFVGNNRTAAYRCALILVVTFIETPAAAAWKAFCGEDRTRYAEPKHLP